MVQVDSTRNVTIVAPGAGDTMWVVGERQCFKLGQAVTDGDYLICETVVVPGGGPPPHVHRDEDEGFYILEGQMEFLGPQCVHVAPAGTFFWAPKRQPHQFRNKGPTPVRYILLAIPGQIERFFRSVATPCRPEEVIPPPLTPELAQHVMTEAGRWGIDVVDLPEPAERRAVPQAVESVEDGVRRLVWCAADDAAGMPQVDELYLPAGAAVDVGGSETRHAALVVLEGAIEIHCSDERYIASAGSYAHLRDSAEVNTGTSPARVLRYLIQARPQE